VRVHNMSAEAVAAMEVIDLATVTEEPPSPIGAFEFHDCTVGVASFKGRPPWELHSAGDELLLVFAGECELTVRSPDGDTSRTLHSGDLAVVPGGHWHCNDSPDGVKMLFITPSAGNDHSWEQPHTG
jgi:mannose-6-phosphate isomerase-like protein (cupin superfamily)